MSRLRRAVKASGFLMSAAGALLFGSKPPAPPESPDNVGELEVYLDKLFEIGRMWLERVSPDFSGAAGANGPAVDTARFVMPFLNGGKANGQRLLAPESVAMMLQDGHIMAKGGPASFYKGVQHGLGWWIWSDGNRQRIMHSGDGPGFSNIMMLYPEEKLGIIMMGNEWAYGVAFRGTAIRDTIADLAGKIDWR